jgi:hypothetical protein
MSTNNQNFAEVRGLRPMPEHIKKGLKRLRQGGIHLGAAYSIMWFRDDHPNWGIGTEMLEYNETYALFRATICDENGVLKGSGHKRVLKSEFPGAYLEKAETGAIARALDTLGYGTEFGEFDESEVPAFQEQGRAQGATSRPAAQPPRQTAQATPRPAAASVAVSGDRISEQQKQAVKNQCQQKNLALAEVLSERCGGKDLGALTQDEAQELIRQLNQTPKRAVTQTA